MRVLVIGGSGFIGTRLVSDLINEGHSVRIFDKAESGKYPELCEIGDIRDAAAVNAALNDVDMVYHLAAEHRDDVSPIALYYDVNVEGTRNIVKACIKNRVNRLVFTSSVAIYGLNVGEPTEDFPAHPFNDYGKSKYQAEEILNDWAKNNELGSLVIVRPSVVFGEGNRGNVYNLVKQIVSGRFVMVGDGRNRKSMSYVGNVSAFLVYMGENVLSGVHIFNYADKPDFTMDELVSEVFNHFGRQASRLRKIPYCIGIIGGLVFDILATITGKKYAVSSVRIRKFCANTVVGVKRIESTGFVPPYKLKKGLELFLKNEF
ncbi:MAG: NAD-dependent epimerase/dehydratase family protein [Nitrospirae bacterium]|nr:NAD-dependent epimerase/dehydratase family protein [Nitrospirota bacterium]